jgi:hypothetical protein
VAANVQRRFAKKLIDFRQLTTNIIINMSRKIYITVPVNLIIRVDEGVSMEQLQEDLIVSAVIADDSKTFNQADIEDTEVGQFQITDSK